MAHYKMGIYGEPAVGKSVFSLGWEKPFFICTDENYDYLKCFGAKDEDHIHITSWEEFKQLVKKFDFSKYETIVVDLIEDLYQWCDAEYCKRNKIDDLSDVGYGKAYKIVRNDFTYYILQLLNKKANVILLSHQDESIGKTTKGVEFSEFNPSSYIPKKCWEMINGKLRFFFRAYIEEKQTNDGFTKKRCLSIRPKPHEFQINRGLDVDSLPDDIDLNYNAFVDLFGKPSNVGEIEYKLTEQVKPATLDDNSKSEEKVEKVDSKVISSKVEETTTKETSVNVIKQPKVETTLIDVNKNELSTQDKIASIKAKLNSTKTTMVESAKVEETKPIESIKEETSTKVDSESIATKTETQMSVAEKIAMIKAKLGK